MLLQLSTNSRKNQYDMRKDCDRLILPVKRKNRLKQRNSLIRRYYDN